MVCFPKDWWIIEKLAEQSAKTDSKIEKLTEQISNLGQEIGGIYNGLGKLTEGLFSPEIYEQFRDFGYTFTSSYRNRLYKDEENLIAEADMVFENQIYMMIVEIKNILNEQDIKKHIERLMKIRDYMDKHEDKRKLLGAVAGVNTTPKTITFAHHHGLFVIVQTGETTAIAPTPNSFSAKEW